VEIQVTARHFSAPSKLSNRISEDIEKLSKFYENITKCHVILDAENKGRALVEIIVGVHGKTLTAKSTAENMDTAMDKTIDKIERQLKKSSEKKHSHRTKPQVQDEYLE
jgi:putative sigma-54 modulation protein